MCASISKKKKKPGENAQMLLPPSKRPEVVSCWRFTYGSKCGRTWNEKGFYYSLQGVAFLSLPPLFPYSLILSTFRYFSFHEKEVRLSFMTPWTSDEKILNRKHLTSPGASTIKYHFREIQIKFILPVLLPVWILKIFFPSIFFSFPLW